MQTLKFNIVTRTRFSLPIIQFNAGAFFGDGSRFESEINGTGDGIGGFIDALTKAAAMLSSKKRREDALRLLFPTGLDKDQKFITGVERIKALTGLRLAGPHLIWSLNKQKDQIILRWLKDTFGITWMEGLHSVLIRPGGHRCAVRVSGQNDGSWAFGDFNLDHDRHSDLPALAFGK